MKIVTTEEMKDYTTKGLAHGKKQAPCVKQLVELMNRLAVGESIQVLRSEWTNRSEPRVKLTNGMKFSTLTLLDNTGWLVVRTS